MASTTRVNAAASSSQSILLPEIPELFKHDFLDLLIPSTTSEDDIVIVDEPSRESKPIASNPLMDALMSMGDQIFTDNGAHALSSTGSPTLDAFNSMSRYVTGSRIKEILNAAWKEDPNLTLRIIWNLRSIHDGKSEKEAFYRAYGWLYDNHPRTAIANLRLLVEPVCKSHKKGKKHTYAAHGYWKDLLNILALATVDQLNLDDYLSVSTFLHVARTKSSHVKTKLHRNVRSRESCIQAAQTANDRAKDVAEATRKAKFAENERVLKSKFVQPKYRALYVAVARLFAEQLIKDVNVLKEINHLESERDRIKAARKISLAGKWAPTPGRSHDRVTNIATAISELLIASQSMGPLPSALNTHISAHQRAVIQRSFYQRWILTELRRVLGCPEPLMAANRWKEIQYNRVPSICMNNNTTHFYKHDVEGFEKFLLSVESSDKSISGATLLPHELVRKVLALANTSESSYVGRRMADTQLRVVEAQWKTLLNSLREAGTIEGSLAICDVSGSMGSIYDVNLDQKHVLPILPAISLSLVLASVAKPPFSGGFITFSATPEFVKVNLEDSLYKQVTGMAEANWGMNTNLRSVFLDLLLPLAIKNKIKQEDMIKRLFIFSDMQFDAAQTSRDSEAAMWETNYDVIEKKYKEAGYEVPQIVYWDLEDSGYKTVETRSERKGVAMMNGFSPAMLKVFMGEQDDEMMVDKKAEEDEWENVAEDGEASVTVVAKMEEEFTPVNVMKKALMRRSFDGLVVVD